jgi:cytoskeletal protein CcmA (bactofilin family)
MLQPSAPQASSVPSQPTTYTPVRIASVPVDQGTIGPSIVIKGEVSGAEPLYIDGKVEGSIHFADHRVTVGRHGSVTANINAKEVVIMGSVAGNIQCSDRVEIRAEGSLAGDIVTRRIIVEDGALLKGSVEVRAAEQRPEAKHDKSQSLALTKPAASEVVPAEKTKAAAAGAGH